MRFPYFNSEGRSPAVFVPISSDMMHVVTHRPPRPQPTHTASHYEGGQEREHRARQHTCASTVKRYIYKTYSYFQPIFLLVL